MDSGASVVYIVFQTEILKVVEFERIKTLTGSKVTVWQGVC